MIQKIIHGLVIFVLLFSFLPANNSQGAAGTGDTDNATFEKDISTLKTKFNADYATKNSYRIHVQTDDVKGGTFEKQFTIRVLSQGVAVAIAAGKFHTCAKTSVGSVKCWGRNNAGQLGDGTQTEQTLTPVEVVGLSSGVSAIAGGYWHTCAVTIAAGVKCWGYNGNGQLGDGTKTDRLTPVDVIGLSCGVSAIAAGKTHTCALTSAGGVKCWGHNINGQLGDGTQTDRLTPVDVIGLSSGVSAIAVGEGHTCAKTSVGGVKCWGDNGYGELGDGTNASSNIPVDVSNLSSGVSAIDTGENYTCAMTSVGGVKCWGYNYNSQLGNGTNTSSNIPVDVSNLSSVVSAIATGTGHTCALTNAGVVKCWGWNGHGQLGNGTNTSSYIPVDVSGLASGVTAITAGEQHTCALTNAGGVKCLGGNVYGQLGDGSQTDRWTPVDIIGFGGANHPPTDISLSSSDIPNGAPPGTVVGTLTSQDEDVGDTLNYSLVAGTGDTDNASFEIDGSTLKTKFAADYATKNSYNIRIHTDDGHGGTYQEQFTISVEYVTLSNTTIAEHLPADTTVGIFTTNGGTSPFVYTLASGAGDNNNASFAIVGDVLKSAQVFDYVMKNSYTIRVRSTDSANVSYEKQFTITITTDGKLHLTSMCTGRWRVRNPNSVSKDFNWDVVNGTENGTGTVPANGEVYFLTVPGHKTVRLRLGLVQDSGDLQDIKATNPVPCEQNAGGDILETIFSHLGGWVPHGTWTITITNGGVTDGSTLFTQLMVSYAGPATNLQRLLHTIEINLQLNGAFIPTPAMPIQVCLTYNSDDLNQVGGDPSRFVIGPVPSDSTEWTMLSTTVNPDTHQVCANVAHLSLFDVFINPLRLGENQRRLGENLSSSLPETAFVPGVITFLPEQPQDKEYINLISLASEETRIEPVAETVSMQLEIPKIDLLRAIVGVPFVQGKWDLTWLYNQIGYLEGTAFPTWNGNTSLTAHVVLPDGILGPFAKLNTLQYGDSVIIHAWGKRYIYEVCTQEEVHPNTLSVFQHEDYAWLTMLTCSHYDEKLKTYRMRTVVRAVLVKIEDE